MPRIVVVGSTNIDLTFRVHRLPQPGETLAGHSLATGFGGKGANQAVMAAREGAAVTFLSALGNDDFGASVRSHLAGLGIDTTFLRATDQPTGTAAILVDDQAHNAIVVVAGANALLSPGDIREARSALESADAVVAQCETPLEVTREAFAIARARGVRTLLNPAPVVPGIEDLLPLTDLVVPNETELHALTGQFPDCDEALEHAAQRLEARGARAVLVTLGGRGCWYRGPAGVLRLGAFEVQAVDTTAAGDAFIGSLAVALGAGLETGLAMRRASAAAALTVTRLGAQSAFPSQQEVDAFLQSR